jgi:hypothetical protein
MAYEGWRGRARIASIIDRFNYGIKGGLVKKTSLVTKKVVILGTG